MGMIVFLLIIGLVVFFIVAVYNRLVALKHGVSKAWSNIDVLLKQRHDELPKLVETCRQHMQFEQATLEKVMQARAAVSSARQQHDLKALGTAETALRGSLAGIVATVEAYPELKSNEQFQFLLQRISVLENSISDRRELYNESVNLNNVRIEQFPDVLVARLFHFVEAPLLSFSEAEKRDPDVKQLFAGGNAA